jgi:type VI secretion system protein VasD
MTSARVKRRGLEIIDTMHLQPPASGQPLLMADAPTPLATRRGLLAAPALALTGCSIFGTSPTELVLQITVGARVNVNELDQPSPVVLRLYDLKATEGFLGADFFDLYDRESTRLGGDLLGRTETILVPGRNIEQARRTVPEEARFLGAVAAYREIEGAEWRVSTALRLNSVNNLTLVVESRSISLRQTRR